MSGISEGSVAGVKSATKAAAAAVGKTAAATGGQTASKAAAEAATAAAATAAAGGQSVPKAPVPAAASVACIPESVVAPLIGAGANVYILTNEFTQSMREKLGGSWPFVQDTLNSRCAKLVAGGLLTSVAAIVLWKIIRRLSQSKPKTPAPTEEESCEWRQSKTFEVTPVQDMKHMSGRPEGETQLPHKIHLRISERPLQTCRPAEGEVCRMRDSATRHRYTRRREQPGESPGEVLATPWTPQPRGEAELTGEAQCCCGRELYAPTAAAAGGGASSASQQPRLLYSVRESRVVQRAMDMGDPRMVNMLTYSSCPSSLCATHTPRCVGASGQAAYGAANSLVAGQCPYHSAPQQAMLMATSHSQAPNFCGHAAAAVYSEPRPSSPMIDGGCRARGERDGDEMTEGMGGAAGVQTQHVPPTRSAQSSVTPSSHCTSHTPTFPSHLAHAQGGVLRSGQQGHTLSCQSSVTCTNHNSQPAPVPFRQHSASEQRQQAGGRSTQQPVVQQASDSTVSQVSCGELQEEQAGDGGVNTIHSCSHTTTPPDVVPRERSVLRQESVAPMSPYPLQAHPPRAIADFAHNELPWRSPSGLHGYQPSPVFMCGAHNPHPHHHHHPHPQQPSWLSSPVGGMGMYVPHHHPMSAPTPGGAFLPNAGYFPQSPQARFAPGHFAPSPHGLYPTHGGLYGSHYPLFGGHVHSPFHYPGHDSKPMCCNPNFNVSNCNPLVFQQPRVLPGPVRRFMSQNAPQSSDRIRVVESDHSISNGDNNEDGNDDDGGDVSGERSLEETSEDVLDRHRVQAEDLGNLAAKEELLDGCGMSAGAHSTLGATEENMDGHRMIAFENLTAKEELMDGRRVSLDAFRTIGAAEEAILDGYGMGTLAPEDNAVNGHGVEAFGKQASENNLLNPGPASRLTGQTDSQSTLFQAEPAAEPSDHTHGQFSSHDLEATASEHANAYPSACLTSASDVTGAEENDAVFQSEADDVDDSHLSQCDVEGAEECMAEVESACECHCSEEDSGSAMFSTNGFETQL